MANTTIKNVTGETWHVVTTTRNEAAYEAAMPCLTYYGSDGDKVLFSDLGHAGNWAVYRNRLSSLRASRKYSASAVQALADADAADYDAALVEEFEAVEYGRMLAMAGGAF